MNLDNNVHNIKEVIKNYPNTVIVAATKYVDSIVIKKLHQLGIKDMGENRVDSFLNKYDVLKDLDIAWHFIGTLQSKKVKLIIDKVDYIHSLDRESLAKKINDLSSKEVKCFVQVNISQEDSKHGVNLKNVKEFIKNLAIYDKIKVVGLMGMAENTNDEQLLRDTFTKLSELQNEIINLNLEYAPCMYLSMGMSNDFKIALSCGATHLRLGSVLYK